MLVLKKVWKSQWNPSLASVPEHALLFAMQRKKGAVDLQGLLKPARPLSAEDALEVSVDEKGNFGFRENKQSAFTSLLSFGFAVDEVVAQFCAA
jgi:hypothetical protein